MIKNPLPPVPAPLISAPTSTIGGSHDEEFLGVYFSYVGVADHEFDAYGFFREFRDGSATSELPRRTCPFSMRPERSARMRAT